MVESENEKYKDTPSQIFESQNRHSCFTKFSSTVDKQQRQLSPKASVHHSVTACRHPSVVVSLWPLLERKKAVYCTHCSPVCGSLRFGLCQEQCRGGYKNKWQVCSDSDHLHGQCSRHAHIPCAYLHCSSSPNYWSTFLKLWKGYFKVISLDELSTSKRIPYLDALIEAGPECVLHYIYMC